LSCKALAVNNGTVPVLHDVEIKSIPDMTVLTPQQIELLLAQRSISDAFPWKTNDLSQIDAFYKDVCSNVSRATATLSKIHWDHYGSGYASFVDAWFYRTTPDFNVNKPLRKVEGHKGLIVLLSRHSPYFVFMEGDKHWHATGGSGYVPVFSMVDDLPSRAVAALAQQMQPLLEGFGLVRAHKADLAAELPSHFEVPTILSDEPFNEFDAIFYWED
jgi:hypothetical protein